MTRNSARYQAVKHDAARESTQCQQPSICHDLYSGMLKRPVRHEWPANFDPEHPAAAMRQKFRALIEPMLGRHGAVSDLLWITTSWSKDFLESREGRLLAFSPNEMQQLANALSFAVDHHLKGISTVDWPANNLPNGLFIKSMSIEDQLYKLDELCVNGNGTETSGQVWSISPPNLQEDSMFNSDDELSKLVAHLKTQLVPALVAEIVPLLRAAVEDAHLTQNVLSSNPSPAPDLSTLLEEQRSAFKKIMLAKLVSPSDKKQFQSYLNKLKGVKATEGVVVALKNAMKKRNLGVVCACGQPAAIMWLRNVRCAHGGLFAFSHVTDGKRMLHATSTVLPSLEIVERPYPPPQKE